MSDEFEMEHQVPVGHVCSDPSKKRCNNSHLNGLVTAVWIYDVERFRILWANDSAVKLWEADSLEELKSRDYEAHSSAALKQTLMDYQKILTSGKSISRMWRYYPKGALKEVYSQLSGYQLEDGRIAMLIEALPVDLIDRNSDTSSVVTISTYNMEGRFISGNPTFIESQNSSYSHLRSLFYKVDDYQRIRDEVEQTGKFEGDVQIIANKKVQWHRLVVSANQYEGMERNLLVQQFNIDDMKRKALTLQTEAITDPLTGLLNRRGLENVVEDKRNFFIFYIDLDGFKLINDSLGHGIGDKVLQYIGQRLTADVFDQGYACRFGGDEFIWLIDEDRLQGKVDDIADKLLQFISNPFSNDINGNVNVSASVGVAHFPKDGNSLDEVVMKADSAMYLAKEQGKHRWISYYVGMENKLQRKSQVSQALFSALENNEFQLYYQPIFDVKTKRIYAFEALLRWDSKHLGRVPTEECIRVAEQIGFITNIETWVIRAAIKDLVHLRAIFDDQVVMAINVSGLYFSNPECIQHIENQLLENNFKNTDVHIEITEGTLLSDLNLEDSGAKRTHKAGIPISIDDFGTGYSSLAYLHQIPANLVKIDRTFTMRIEEDPTLISGIKCLIESLRLGSIVEGVETLEQCRILKDIGLFLQQGYGLGMPQPLSFYQNKDNLKSLAGLK